MTLAVKAALTKIGSARFKDSASSGPLFLEKKAMLNQIQSEASLSTAEIAQHYAQAEEIIYHNVLWAMGAGVIPIPIFDVLAVGAVQLKMLRQLSLLYGVKFSKGLAKKLIAALTAGLGGLGGGLFIGSLAKSIPGLGTTLSVACAPVLVGAITYALGRIFLMHFESGGTFLDFNPEAFREHFRREFEKIKNGEVPFAAIKGAASSTVASANAAPACPPSPLPASATPALVVPVAAAAALAQSVILPIGADVVIVDVHYKGALQGKQSDEYVEISNHGTTSADLSRWKLSADAPGQVFTFPTGTSLAPGQSIRIYTNEVHPETGGFSFGIKRAIWNDNGDRARLHDATGKLVSQFSYGDERN